MQDLELLAHRVDHLVVFGNGSIGPGVARGDDRLARGGGSALHQQLALTVDGATQLSQFLAPFFTFVRDLTLLVAQGVGEFGGSAAQQVELGFELLALERARPKAARPRWPGRSWRPIVHA